MKVKIEFTLDIDTESWVLNYGTAPEYIRDDVKEHAENSLTDHFRELGLLKAN